MDTLKFIAIITITFSAVLILYAKIEDRYWKKKAREEGGGMRIIGKVEKYMGSTKYKK